jgi:hypothetical protein
MGSLVFLRVTAHQRATASTQAELDTREFWAPLLVLWLASIARVTLALRHAEVFGTEATLAIACLVGLPLAATRRWLVMRSSTLATSKFQGVSGCARASTHGTSQARLVAVRSPSDVRRPARPVARRRPAGRY